MQSTRFKRRFRTGIILQVLTAARDQIQRLTGSAEAYFQDLSIEENFIVRAGPLFEEASQIYAVSIDRFSEFWIAEDQRTRAEEYTSHQPKNTIRLFVFSSVETAQKYRYVLAAHHARYGKDGAVLLTSTASHKSFLASIDVGSVPELLQKDFAILRFTDRPNDSSIGPGDHEYYEATLSHTKLVCKQLRSIRGSYQAFMDSFEELRDTPDGQGKLGIVKWQTDFKFDDSKWTAALSKVFGISSEVDGPNIRPVYHIVFLGATNSPMALVRHVEDNVRLRLEGLVGKKSGDKLIDDFWFGSRNEVVDKLQVADGKYGGQLLTTNVLAKDFPFCLVLRFRNMDDLREYYEDPVHSQVRRDLLSFCNPKLGEMYKLLDPPQRLDARETKLIYDAIETAASSIMIRADFGLECPSRGLLNIQPVDFNLPE